jgi:S1-C subfamily serine protease
VAVNQTSAEALGVDADHGVYVVAVMPGSAAADAGIRGADSSGPGGLPRGGDVILAVDGQDVADTTELLQRIDEHQVGDEVTLTVLRDGERIEVTVTLEEWQVAG